MILLRKRELSVCASSRQWALPVSVSDGHSCELASLLSDAIVLGGATSVRCPALNFSLWSCFAKPSRSCPLYPPIGRTR